MSPYELSPFVTLPVPFIALMLAGFLFMRRRRFQRVWILSVTLLLAASCTPFFGRLIVLPLVVTTDPQAVIRLEKENLIAFVVPTGGMSQIADRGWWPTLDSLIRATFAWKLAEPLNVPLVLAGGPPGPGAPSEAEVTAQAMAVPAGRLILETRPRNTFETGRDLQEIIAELGNGKIIVVTSPAHTFRTAAVFRRFGYDAFVVASDEWSWVDRRDLLQTWTDVLPSRLGMGYTNRAIAEYAAILWYLAKGRLALRDLF